MERMQDQVESILREDRAHRIKAVMVVHNETSSAVTNSVPSMRKAMDRAKHPALLMVDTISSLASMDYRHDEWGVDVAIGGSQKGLMLPPGLGFNAMSEKALAASKSARLPKSYWDWQAMLGANKAASFPTRPRPTCSMDCASRSLMLHEEGLENVFERHARHGEATRRAVRAWGLETVCADPERYSSSVTAVYVPPASNADDFRKVVLENFNMSLGSGLGRLDFNDLLASAKTI
jgi:alanine-glyoxylate transaminase/serine-glyoxylate transaminase/serine-pyruvate transaminase